MLDFLTIFHQTLNFTILPTFESTQNIEEYVNFVYCEFSIKS